MQSNLDIQNSTGYEFRQNVIKALKTIADTQISVEEPSETFPGAKWADSSVVPLRTKVRNSGDTSWFHQPETYQYDSSIFSNSAFVGYNKGDVVMRSDGMGYWYSTVDNNTTDPEVAGADDNGWVPEFTTGTANVTVNNTDVTLTPLQYGRPVIIITGSVVANLNLILPNVPRSWVIINNATGNYNITAKTATGSGVIIPKGGAYFVVGDGTNIYSHEANAQRGALRTPYDYGAHSNDEPGFENFDSTAAISAGLAANGHLWIPPGKLFNVTVVGLASEGMSLFSDGTGGLQQIDGAQSTIYIAARRIVVRGLRLVGKKPALNYDGNDNGVLIDSSGVTVEKCDISYFAGSGILMGSNGGSSPIEYPSAIRANRIHHNSTGINQGSDYEYLTIEGNLITLNGFNNSFTDYAADWRSSGYYGRMSNTAILNNMVLDNATGIFVDAGGGSNPDHNKISGNTINHNWVIGLMIWAPRNYVMVADNIILSNILHPAAPALVYAPTGSAHDMVLVDVPNCVFSGNAIGVGSYADYIPIFGHGRCRYVNNQFLWGVPKEMRAPQAGSALYENYGYAGYNGDNLFTGNLFDHRTLYKPVLLSNTLNTVCKDNLEAIDGGIHLVDNVLKTPTMNANWLGQYTGYEPLRFWRTGGNTVHIVGTLVNTGSGGDIAFNLPARFRPTNIVDTLAINGTSGAIILARLYPNGDLQPVSAATNVPVQINMVFNI